MGAKSRDVRSQSQSKEFKESNDHDMRSRNTTPLSSPTELSPVPVPTFAVAMPEHSPYLNITLSALLVQQDATIETMFDNQSATGNTPPTAETLDRIYDQIVSKIVSHTQARGQACDRAMRELARKRKERIERERDRDDQERIDEERKRRDASRVASRKRAHDEMEDETRPPAVGLHGVARQDGVGVHTLAAIPLPTNEDDPMVDVDKKSSESPERHHQPRPAPIVAQYQSFGDDPSKYNDPTIYHIREVTESMNDDEKRSIYSVANFPHDDLHDLTPGTPPDLDLSNAKPTNQVAAATFQAFVDQYVRPLTEEDVAFLKERGDRVGPFLVPNRGPMPYREVWAREDGLNPRDPSNDHLPFNEARGGIEDMNDEVATTEEVSTGPLLARFLSIFRHDAGPAARATDGGDVNGDTTLTNLDNMPGEQENAGLTEPEENDAEKPTTYLAELTTTATNKPAFPSSNRGFGTLEQRMLAELRYNGLLTPETTPDFDGHFDDEIAARLRHLQSELSNVVIENGARKARVLELTLERMALQEYAMIAEDLDNQVNAAYTKRNRTLGKPKKGNAKARSGLNSAGVAVSRNNLSEGVKALMDRRLEWRDKVGPVFETSERGIPKETVFDEISMERLTKVEAEAGDVEDL